jgi:hypothetical protein
METAILLKKSIAKMKKIKMDKVRKRSTDILILNSRVQESLTKMQMKKKRGTTIINFRVRWWLKTNKSIRIPNGLNKREIKQKRILQRKVTARSSLTCSTHKIALCRMRRIINSDEVTVKVKKMKKKTIKSKHKKWMLPLTPKQKTWRTQHLCKYCNLLLKASQSWFRQQCRSDS